MLPQNQCFVRGFRQLLAHLTKCHACHAMCTWSLLRTALPMRFAENTKHSTSEMLRLPPHMKMDAAKVLHLPRKVHCMFGKPRKSIAPATQNDFRHVTQHVHMSQSATPAMRNEATQHLKHPKITPFATFPMARQLSATTAARRRLRTVAKG